jgi:succinate dehydrogenase / fumarate reductase membrane anchor subunit
MIGQHTNNYRTPLGRVRGLGPAHTGTKHFWHSRVTSVAGVPLTIAFVIIAIILAGRNHAAVVQIMGSPVVSILLTLFVLTNVYHMWIGMQEIIVDYVHADTPKFAALLANTFFCFCVGAVCIFALMKISFGV